MLLLAAGGLAIATGCKKEVGPLDRELRLTGLPACAADAAYDHEVVAEFKRGPPAGETLFTSGLTFSTPPRPLLVPTTAFTRTLQVSICDPTRLPHGGMSTVCSTPSILVFERELTVPAGTSSIEVSIGPVVGCGKPGSAIIRYLADE